jgi:hypothetical protein
MYLFQTSIRWCVLLFTVFISSVSGFAQLNFIPWPQSVVTNGGEITVSSGRIMYNGPSLEQTAETLSNHVAMTHRFAMPVIQGTNPAPNDIYVTLSTDAAITGETYRITVDTWATLEAETPGSAAQGSLTLVQAINQNESSFTLPRMVITDYPYREFRAVMIDIKNKWHPINELKKFVKLAQFYKIKKLFLHTGEAQWMAAVLASTSAMTPVEREAKRWYSNEEMTNLIDYAEKRGITLVPHNESISTMPGMNAIKDFMDEIDGQGAYIGPDFLAASDRYWNVLKELTHRSMDQFGGSNLLHYHVGPIDGEVAHYDVNTIEPAWHATNGITSSAEFYRWTALELLNIIIQRNVNTKMLFWAGINPWVEGTTAFPMPKDKIIIYTYSHRGGGPNGYLQNGFHIMNSGWSPLYLLTSVQRTQDQIYDHWNYYRYGTDGYYNGAFIWERITWYDFDNPAYYNQVHGGVMCTWEMPATIHFEKLRPRLPMFADRAWHHKSSLPFSDISNRFIATDAMFGRFMMDPFPPSVPVSVAASDGIYSNKILVTWQASYNTPEAYIIYRNTINDSSSASIITTNGLAPFYEDYATVQGQDYYYWIKAINYFGESSLSASARGRLGIGVDLPLAYEGFCYTTNESIDAKNGGKGWTNAWDITSANGTITVKSPGLQYGTLPVNGNCINFSPAEDSGVALELTRSTIDQFGHNSTPMWVGVLFRGNTIANAHFFFKFNSYQPLAFGKRFGGAFAFDNTSSSKFPVQGETHFVVVKYDFRDGNDDAYMWIDPSLDSEPDTANCDVTRSDSNLGLGRKLDIQTRGWGLGNYDIDELRITRSWEELITLGAASTNPPAPPTGLTASQGTYLDKIVVTWDASDTATKYSVYRNVANDRNSATVLASDLTGMSYDDTNATFSTEYFYWVKAGNDNGWSDYSEFTSGFLMPEPSVRIIGAVIAAFFLHYRK